MTRQAHRVKTLRTGKRSFSRDDRPRTARQRRCRRLYGIFDSSPDRPSDAPPGHPVTLDTTIDAWSRICHSTVTTTCARPPGGDYTAFLTMGDDRAGYVVEVDETVKIFTNPREQLTEDYISGRFG